MMRPLVQTIAQTANYSPGQVVKVDIPRDGIIVGIDILLEAQYDNGTTPTPVTDAFHRIIQSLEISGGTPKYVKISSMTLLHLLNMCDRGNGYKSPKVDTTANQADNKAKIPYFLHFGNNPALPFDPHPGGGMVVGIPAVAETSVTASVGFDANTVMGSGITVDPATLVRFSVRVLQGVQAQVMRPVISTDVYSITQTWSNFGLRFKVPTGKWVRRLAIMALDNSTPRARADDRISRVGLIIPGEAQSRRLELSWYELKALTLAQYPFTSGIIDDGRAPNVDGSDGQVGFAVLDFRKISHHRLGLNMLGRREGEIEIGIDIPVSSGELHLLWDTVEPV